MLAADSSAATTVQGWLYDLLRWIGVSQTTAAHVQQVIVKPVTVVLILVGSVFVGWLGSRAIRHWIGAAVRRAASRADSPRAERRALTLTAMVASIWRVVIGVMAVLVALGTVGINLTPVLAGATVIGATIGFGAQSIVRDVLAGFLMTVEGQYDIGDTIALGDISGVVEDLTFRVTRLRGDDGAVWYVANGEVRKVANTTRGWGRASVDVVVPPHADVAEVLDVIQAASSAVHDDPSYRASCLDDPVQWGVVASALDSVTARVTVRTPAAEANRVERAIRKEIAVRLHSAGVYDVPAQP